MNKEWYKSMTFYGAVLLAIEVGLIAMEADYPVLKPVVAMLAVFLTTFGFRRALK